MKRTILLSALCFVPLFANASATSPAQESRFLSVRETQDFLKSGVGFQVAEKQLLTQAPARVMPSFGTLEPKSSSSEEIALAYFYVDTNEVYARLVVKTEILEGGSRRVGTVEFQRIQ